MKIRAKVIIFAAVSQLAMVGGLQAQTDELEVYGLNRLPQTKPGELPVGTVIQSILPPKAFLQDGVKPAGIWVLADGSELKNQDFGLAEFMKLNRNSYYAQELFDGQDRVRMPDMGGMFLRGIDTKDNGRGEPLPPRKVGEYQNDMVGRHSHIAAHTYPTSINAPDLDAGNATLTLKDWRPVYPLAPEASTQDYTVPEGHQESRPENMAIYIYIRVE